MWVAIIGIVAFVLGVVFAPAIRTDIINAEDHIRMTYAAEKAALKATAQDKISKL
jgi:hypothetical protein